jgi:hypothetical protein
MQYTYKSTITLTIYDINSILEIIHASDYPERMYPLYPPIILMLSF